MSSFTFLYFIKRNDRIRNKFAEITRIKGLSTDYYQVKKKEKLRKKIKRFVFLVKKDLCRQRMQAQPTRRISPEIHKIPTDSHVKRDSQSSSSRNSTSSWTEEPVTNVNMDIMTGHLILVC